MRRPEAAPPLVGLERDGGPGVGHEVLLEVEDLDAVPRLLGAVEEPVPVGLDVAPRVHAAVVERHLVLDRRAHAAALGVAHVDEDDLGIAGLDRPLAAAVGVRPAPVHRRHDRRDRRVLDEVDVLAGVAVGRAALALASELTGAVTGTCQYVDNGMHAMGLAVDSESFAEYVGKQSGAPWDDWKPSVGFEKHGLPSPYEAAEEAAKVA